MKSFLDFGKQLQEAPIQPNGTDKIIPDEGMCEGLCQVCGTIDCKEHFYKSPAVTGYVKEETGKDHDYAHVKKTMKKVDHDTFAKHMLKNDADHSMENKHGVDTQHSGSYTGKIHGAEVTHKHSDSGKAEYYIKEEKDYSERNTEIKAALSKKGINGVQGRDITHYEKGSVISHNGVHSWKPNGEVKQHLDVGKASQHLHEETLDELIRLQKATHTSNPFGAQHKDAENPNDRIRLARDAKDNRAHNRRGHSPEGSNYDPNRRGAASVKTVHNDVKANRSTDYISKKLSRPADKNKSWNDVKEEVEQIDELSYKKLDDYVHRSFAHGNELHKQIDTETDADKKAKLKAKLSQRNSGVIKAAQKMRNESQEKKPYTVISHVSDGTGTRADGEKEEKQRVATRMIASSPEEAIKMARIHHTGKGRKVHASSIKEDVDTVKKDASGKVIAWSHEGDWQKNSTKNKQGSGKAANLAGKALQQTKQLAKEEVEELDELSKGTLASYVKKSAADASGNAGYIGAMRNSGSNTVDKAYDKLKKRHSGIAMATAKLTKEEKDETEYGYEGDMAMSQLKTIIRHSEHLMGMLQPDTDLPEWVQSKITLATDYMQTAHDYLMSEMNESLDEGWEVYDTKTRAIHSSHPTQRKAVNAMNKLNDKHPGYETPGDLIASKFGARVSKSVKEEVALDEAEWGNDKMTNLRQAHDRHMEKALAANKAGDDSAVKVHQRKMQMIQGKMQKLKRNEEVELGEECEILSELSKNALGNYAKAAAFDIANKGSAVAKAGNNLAMLAHPKGPLTQLNKRLQGHAKAVEKLTKEEVEELDELSKGTLGSYVKKASEQGKKAAVSAGQSGQGLGIALASGNKHLAGVHDDNIRYSNNLERKRKAGVSKAVDRLTKEENMLSYSEFMAQLAESRADDLKDKLAADREARLNNYDYSKEKAAKKNPITKVKGHSYGAGDEDGEAEPVKAAEPAEKRGRGRPAGSKSGARA